MVVTAPARSTDELNLGTRIRAIREQRGLSGGELAMLAGVSKSLVSQIERGVASPSIDTVRKLASALNVPVFSLFLEDADNQLVVRRAHRRTVRYPGSRVTREILSPTLHGQVVVLRVTFPPGEKSTHEPVHHVGEETVVVLRGELDVALGDQHVRLEEGDSMAFDSNMPHRFGNPSAEPTEIITAISPPNL